MCLVRFVVAGLLLALPLLGAAQRPGNSRWEKGEWQGTTRVGIWEYYSYAASGERVVAQRYDHTAGTLLYCRADDRFYQAETRPDHWESTLLDQPPWFMGGHEALAAYVAKLRYPAAAEVRNIQGKVVIGFVVDTLGRPIQHRVVRGIGFGCDEEALRVSLTIPDTWVPARLAGRAVQAVYELPFTFRLD